MDNKQKPTEPVATEPDSDTQSVSFSSTGKSLAELQTEKEMKEGIGIDASQPLEIISDDAATKSEPIIDRSLPPLPGENRGIINKLDNQPVAKTLSEVNSTQTGLEKLQGKPEHEIIEKVIYKSRGGGISLNPFTWFRKIKNLACTGCVLIIIFIVCLFITIVFRPPVTWNLLKQFLNGEYTPPSVEQYTPEQAMDYINSSVGNFGNNVLSLNESQVSALVRQKIGGGDDLRVDFEPDTFRLIGNLDYDTDTPLWLIIELSENSENKLEVKKLGFGRLDLPQFLKDFVGDLLLKGVNLAQGKFSDQSTGDLLSFLIKTDLSVDVHIDDVQFKKDGLVINYTLK